MNESDDLMISNQIIKNLFGILLSLRDLSKRRATGLFGDLPRRSYCPIRHEGGVKKFYTPGYVHGENFERFHEETAPWGRFLNVTT